MSTLLKLDIIFFSWICFKNELQLLHLALSNMQIFSAFTCSLAPSSGRVGALWSPVTSSFGCVLLSAGVSALSAQLAKLPMGLKHLSLSRTSMSPKGEHAEAQRCKLHSRSELFSSWVYVCRFLQVWTASVRLSVPTRLSLPPSHTSTCRETRWEATTCRWEAPSLLLPYPTWRQTDVLSLFV